jgi:transcriptional regulator with XRE-family HTH domain
MRALQPQSIAHERLGKAIRQARATKGWDQATLAKSLGVSRGQISFYEAGVNWPGAVVAHRLREVLGLEVTDEPTLQPAVPPVSASLAPGIRYAALKMSEVVTELLRRAVEAEEAAEAAALEALRAEAIAKTQAAARAARQPASETPTPRRRKGTK